MAHDLQKNKTYKPEVKIDLSVDRQRKKWELITCMLLYFRDRMNLKAPIYFSTGLTEKVLYSEMELMFKIGFI